MAEEKIQKRDVAGNDPAAKTRFSKAQILGSERFRGRRDLMDAILEDGKRYTLEDAKKIMKAYLGRKVG